MGAQAGVHSERTLHQMKIAKTTKEAFASLTRAQPMDRAPVKNETVRGHAVYACSHDGIV